MNAINKFTHFINDTSFSSIPEEIINITKKLILDILGSIIYSSTKKWCTIINSYVFSLSAQGKSTVIPSGFQTNAASAALANGTMAHGFELDDGHISAKVHPGAVVIPAVLAAGEQQSINGRKLILSIILGYEAMCRIGLTIKPHNHILKGFHPTGTVGPFGAAIGVGKVLNLNEEKLIDSLGIAGSFCSGLMQFSQEKSDSGDMIKRLHAGKASENGLLAAYLAKEGFKGPSDIIEGKYGFCNVYSEEPEFNLLTKNLGLDYEMKNIYIKPYPCCKTLHTIIDAIIKLKSKYLIKNEDIKEIKVYGNKKLNNYHGIYEINSIMGAQFSAPFIIALALLGDPINPDYYNKKFAHNGKYMDLMNKTKLIYCKEFQEIKDAEGVKVEILFNDGKMVSKKVIYAKGHPKNEMNFDEVSEKFNRLTKNILPIHQINKTIDMVKKIETINDISSLISFSLNKKF